ncbi:hypothetical protein [Spiroplasma endosymbiont of Labia minor]|uniref:hypothetical protein n=1 Tax=Spiroplasma endosymbiont of Labia minor TaxID=3066305 RepID=UPI0030D50CE1
MSKTAREVLMDYQRSVNHITRDINLLRETILKIISECKEIDNSKLSVNELEQLLIELNLFDKEINEKAYDKKIPSDTHIAVETFKEINNYLQRKVDDILNIKVKAQEIRKNVLAKERELILKKYNDISLNNFKNIFEKIILEFKNLNQKNIAQLFFDQNMSKLINMNTNEIMYELNEFIKNQEAKDSAENIVKELVNNYKDDSDSVNLIKNEALTFVKKISSDNFSMSYKEFIKETEKKITDEEIRKDIVRKIIISIRNLGFNVERENVLKSQDGNNIIIRGEKITGETATFKVNLDGSYIYDFDGYEEHEHDKDSDAFIQKLRDFGLGTSNEFEKVYRQPTFKNKNASAKILKNNKNTKKN